MTVLCVTNDPHVPLRPCTIRGEHRIACMDHPVNRAIYEQAHRAGQLPEGSPAVLDRTCGGCLPMEAEHGHLCARCFERVEAAVFSWNRFVELLEAAEGRAVSPSNGGVKGSAADGYTNLTLAMLAVDECRSYLRDRGARTLDEWIAHPNGARNAILFATSAEAAYRSLQVEEQKTRVRRERCPNCDLLASRGHLTREENGHTVIECEWCGHELDRIRDDSARWIGSDSCENDGHLECTSFQCRCECHTYGRAKHPQYSGVSSLWNADIHLSHPNTAPRALWVVDDAHTIRLAAGEHERKTA